MQNQSYLFRCAIVLLGSLCLYACSSQHSSSAKEMTSTEAQGENSSSTHQLWHTVTLDFAGPNTSESAEDNPFLNYRMSVEFEHKDSKYRVRGFFAADGNAAESSAEEGNVWRVRFTPDRVGEWNYTASLHYGEDIALEDDLSSGKSIPLERSSGRFQVVESRKKGSDFRAHGRLIADGGYFRFKDSGEYWLKMGANSPENILGFNGIDGTYRYLAEARGGEAAAPEVLHQFMPHLKDWNKGDPTWQDGKGKALIGVYNYLASKGMNVSYFLTLNIGGDGKDVWPYINHKNFTRFDVSKLDQWEIIFSHMQAKGILLHVVLQETELEMLLDNGDTGPQRQLYFSEMIARFGHHLGLVWNLGEENGPASWAPHLKAQNDEQRRAMATFLKQNDPYNHPVLLHTHAHKSDRDDILDDILGFKDLDGLSLQEADRAHAPEVVAKWRKKAKEAGQDWLITMDEIGMWHTAVLPDALNPGHYALRRHVLWGTLLSGGAGVEWYFGAKFPPHTDLGTEDLRSREKLWQISKHAKDFFDQHIPYWKMQVNHSLVQPHNAYCLAEPGEIYAIYLPELGYYRINLPEDKQEYSVHWYNPLKGGPLMAGSLDTIQGGKQTFIGYPPTDIEYADVQDWVVLIKKR